MLEKQQDKISITDTKEMNIYTLPDKDLKIITLMKLRVTWEEGWKTKQNSESKLNSKYKKCIPETQEPNRNRRTQGTQWLKQATSQRASAAEVKDFKFSQVIWKHLVRGGKKNGKM